MRQWVLFSLCFLSCANLLNLFCLIKVILGGLTYAFDISGVNDRNLFACRQDVCWLQWGNVSSTLVDMNVYLDGIINLTLWGILPRAVSTRKSIQFLFTVDLADVEPCVSGPKRYAYYLFSFNMSSLSFLIHGFLWCFLIALMIEFLWKKWRLTGMHVLITMLDSRLDTDSFVAFITSLLFDFFPP